MPTYVLIPARGLLPHIVVPIVNDGIVIPPQFINSTWTPSQHISLSNGVYYIPPLIQMNAPGVYGKIIEK